jgi:hypothetical protein
MPVSGGEVWHRLATGGGKALDLHSASLRGQIACASRDGGRAILIAVGGCCDTGRQWLCKQVRDIAKTAGAIHRQDPADRLTAFSRSAGGAHS